MSHDPDTIAALATPVGSSAIAMVRATGPAAANLIEDIWGSLPPPRTAGHGDYRNVAGDLLDDVVYVYFKAPQSYTGEDTVEISCHGNPLIAQKILEDLCRRGCRPAEAGEFTKRAFLNGRMDLSQAEAVMDVIHARSERALASAHQLLRGSLGRQMDGLIRQLLAILARVEAYIDFPEEDLPPEDRGAILADLERLRAETGRLLATSHYGSILREGMRTVILGETNAGKSSLLNRLVGRDRALVSAEPGTTRDYLEEGMVIGPHFLRLVDTAGLNQRPTEIEQRGIDKTLEQAAGADLHLWVIDASAPLPTLPPVVRSRLTPANTIAIFNKIDLPEAGTNSVLPDGFPSVRVSALHGDGLDLLENTIVRLADSFSLTVGEDLIAINSRHALALEAAHRALLEARQKLDQSVAIELVASDLRIVLDEFGSISGKVDNEKMLDLLFSTFCIGK